MGGPNSNRTTHTLSIDIMDIRYPSNSRTGSNQPRSHQHFVSTNQSGMGPFPQGIHSNRPSKCGEHQNGQAKNAFKQIWWTCETIQCVWDLEAEHWKCHNGDKHGTTPAETDQKKQQKLLMQAQELLQTKHLLPPRYKKMFLCQTKQNMNQQSRNMGQHYQTNCPLSTQQSR
jgi:hypothetical protein